MLIALQKYAKFSSELKEAEPSGSFAKALRRHVKRKMAVQTASPFSLSTVAFAHKYIYQNGLLVYTVDDPYKLRILSLHQSVSDELVVDVRRLVEAEKPNFSGWSRSEIQPLHHSDGIISCLLTDHAGTFGDGGWLIFWAVDSPAKTLQMLYIETTLKIFVRNNCNYLYCGVLDAIGDSDSLGWLLQCFDLRKRKKSPDSFPLLDFVGNNIGQNACFEVIDDFLYGVSNEQICDPETQSWNSFYYVFRVKMGDHIAFELLPTQRSWRRHGSEGAIDNRWTSLDLVKDEQTGLAVLYETRKEWSAHNSYSQRNCYRKELDFPPGLDSSDYEDMDLDAKDMERHREIRLPSDLHAGDCGSNSATPSFMEMLAFSYNSSARCFVDLVRYRPPGMMGEESIRLRVRPMRRVPMDHYPERGGQALSDDPGVFVWPPLLNDAGQPDSPTSQVREILKVPSAASKLDWSADEKCLVFAYDRGDNANNLKVINLISFDPELRFYGHQRLAAAQSAYSIEPPWRHSIPRSPELRYPGWLYKAPANYVWIRDRSGCYQQCFDFSL